VLTEQTGGVLARHRYRRIANLANLSTPIGLVVGLVGGARPSRGPRGLVLAGGYRLPVPDAVAFTIGNVVVARMPAQDLLHRPALLAHEERHAWQYVALGGPLYWPVYLLTTTWSWLFTGDRASHNLLERAAGLADGGYRERASRRQRRARRSRVGRRRGASDRRGVPPGQAR